MANGVMYQGGRTLVMGITSIYVVTHVTFLVYSIRGSYTNYSKGENDTIYKTFVFMYASRSTINVLNIIVDFATLTALCMASESLKRSESNCTPIRCFTDPRDALALMVGSNIILTLLSLAIRGWELYFIIFVPEDCLDGFFNLKERIIRRNIQDPEYNSHRISVFVALCVVNCLFVGFKGLLVLKCYEFYEDISLLMKRAPTVFANAPLPPPAPRPVPGSVQGPAPGQGPVPALAPATVPQPTSPPAVNAGAPNPAPS